MAATNLDTSNRVVPNSPRDLWDTSLLSTCAGVVLDSTDGCYFANSGSELLLVHNNVGAAGDDTAQDLHILRQDSTVPQGDAASGTNTYDVVSVPADKMCVLGPFNPARYNDANGLVNIATATAASDATALLAVINIRSRRSARSTVTR